MENIGNLRNIPNKKTKKHKEALKDIEEFKRRHKGLIKPPLESGEEEQENREPTETEIAPYLIEQGLKEKSIDRNGEKLSIEEAMKDPVLLKNALTRIKSDASQGLQEGNTDSTWSTLRGFSFAYQLNLPEMIGNISIKNQDQRTKLLEIWQNLEKSIKNPILLRNALVKIKSDVSKGLQEGNADDAWHALNGFFSAYQLNLPKMIDNMKNQAQRTELLEMWRNIEKNIKNPILLKNALTKIKGNVSEGLQKGNIFCAWLALYDFSSPLQINPPKMMGDIKDKAQRTELLGVWQNLEENIKNPVLLKNALAVIKNDASEGLQEGDASDAWSALMGYNSITHLQNRFQSLAEKERRETEKQQALKAGEKKIPKRPEGREF